MSSAEEVLPSFAEAALSEDAFSPSVEAPASEDSAADAALLLSAAADAELPVPSMSFLSLAAVLSLEEHFAASASSLVSALSELF